MDSEDRLNSYSLANSANPQLDWITALIALATLGALLQLKRLPEPLLILLAGVLGILIRS
jgi:chromate transport protein ChrA